MKNRILAAIAVLVAVAGLVAMLRPEDARKAATQAEAPPPPGRVELVMFDDEACPWCLRFKEEVLPVYPKTEEGRTAPIRIIDAAEIPSEYDHLPPVVYTPTFVLLDEERHVIGRIEGYPGYEDFWFMLGELLEKLKEHKTQKAARQQQPQATPNKG